MTQTPTQQITSVLNLKFIAAYFKSAHKERDIRVQRREDKSLYLSDGMCAVNVPYVTPDIPFTVFDAEWERATFRANYPPPAEAGGPDIEVFFRSWGKTNENHTLTLTPFLLEIPGTRNKPGQFSRKLATYNLKEEAWAVYIEKKMMDMLNPDLDELKGFLFETSGHERPVRVSAVNGIVAYLMPKQNIERYLAIQ